MALNPKYPNPYSTRSKTKKTSQGEPLPHGSGFDKLVGKRADRNNLPGRTNNFGDRMITGSRKLNTLVGNPRSGQEFSTGMTAGGNIVHYYQYGKNRKRVVLNKKATGGTYSKNI